MQCAWQTCCLREIKQDFQKDKHVIKNPNKKLNEVDCSEILTAANLPIVKSSRIENLNDLSSFYKNNDNNYVMKILSSDIQHKTDVGGVILNIENIDQAKEALKKIHLNIKEKAPNASIDGVVISPMIKGGVECILGAKIDPVFGPIVMFGLGGIYTEVMKDISFAEAPVSSKKAEKMILSLKSKDVFFGARGQPPVDIKSLIEAIVNLSNLIAANFDRIDQVEMNPILVSENRVVALDALIVTK